LLILIPTPIGNISDISFRALKALEDAEIILSEDTRVTKKLLQILKERFSITPKVQKYISLHSHNEDDFVKNLKVDFFNQNVIFVTDAGMPCISDPGAKLVDFCIKNGVEYDILSGANALLLAYASSGFLEKEFIFFGFLHNRGKERNEELHSILNSKFNTIIYESPERILKLLSEISDIDKDRELFLTKELTKLHQKRFRGTAFKLLEELKSQNLNGEWVVVIKGSIEVGIIEKITKNDILELDIAKKTAAKLISKISGKSIKECYDELIEK